LSLALQEDEQRSCHFVLQLITDLRRHDQPESQFDSRSFGVCRGIPRCGACSGCVCRLVSCFQHPPRGRHRRCDLCPARASGSGIFCFGAFVQRWLRGAWLLLWLLVPIVSVYLVAVFGQPGAYRCNPLNTTYVGSCWIVLSPFLVSAAAVVAGYLAGHRIRR
jgi:hypothetical protein